MHTAEIITRQQFLEIRQRFRGDKLCLVFEIYGCVIFLALAMDNVFDIDEVQLVGGCNANAPVIERYSDVDLQGGFAAHYLVAVHLW